MTRPRLEAWLRGFVLVLLARDPPEEEKVTMFWLLFDRNGKGRRGGEEGLGLLFNEVRVYCDY
jgi:hypothetical protein